MFLVLRLHLLVFVYPLFEVRPRLVLSFLHGKICTGIGNLRELLCHQEQMGGRDRIVAARQKTADDIFHNFRLRVLPHRL